MGSPLSILLLLAIHHNRVMTLSSKKTQAMPISIQKQLHQEGSFPYYRLESIERFLPSDRQKKDTERRKINRLCLSAKKSPFSPSGNPRLGRTQTFPLQKKRHREQGFFLQHRIPRLLPPSRASRLRKREGMYGCFLMELISLALPPLCPLFA